MSGFQYWVPSVATTVKLDELHGRGLAYALEDRVTKRGAEHGPDGARGITVCHGGNESGQLGYWPERQTWKRIPGSDCWCGMYTDNRPKPADLARAEQITGEWLLLEDGHRWLAPKARRWVEMDDRLLWDYNLPRRMALNEDGIWQLAGIKPRYERLWTLAMAYEQAATEALMAADDGEVVRFTFEDIDTLAISALQVNYRLGPVELDLLGIYDDSTRQSIIDVLLDNKTWQAWVKKKAAEALSGESS